MFAGLWIINLSVATPQLEKKNGTHIRRLTQDPLAGNDQP